VVARGEDISAKRKREKKLNGFKAENQVLLSGIGAGKSAGGHLKREGSSEERVPRRRGVLGQRVCAYGKRERGRVGRVGRACKEGVPMGGDVKTAE